MTPIFHARPNGRFMEIKSNLRRKRNFTEQIKTPIFFEAVLAVENMYEPQFNLEDQGNSSILKDDFSARADPSTFTSIELVLLDQSNEIS